MSETKNKALLMMKAVIDTSVLISAFLFPESKPAIIYRMAKQGEYELCLSPFILNEFAFVLRSKFRISEQKISRQMQRFQKIAILVPAEGKLSIIKEKKSDNYILETALNAHADYLITGDKKHILPLKQIGSTRIVSPAEFLQEFY